MGCGNGLNSHLPLAFPAGRRENVSGRLNRFGLLPKRFFREWCRMAVFSIKSLSCVWLAPAVLALSPAPAAGDSNEPDLLAFPASSRTLMEQKPEAFFMGVEREGELDWRGGVFGFVRAPFFWNGEIIHGQFHEGIDIAPVERDPAGGARDEIKAAAAGTVVFRGDGRERTGYGVQVLLRHDLPCGPVFTRYAHLAETRVKPGETVERGAPLGRMGHTGGGIPAARAHLHFELNLMLNESADPSRLPIRPDAGNPRFHRWNFAGVDPAALLRQTPERRFSESLTELIGSLKPYFTVEAAGNGTRVPDLLKRHPWLRRAPDARVNLTEAKTGTLLPANGWRIHFTAWGLPVALEPLDDPPSEPRVVRVEDSGDRQHSWRTGGLLSGSGAAAALTPGGAALVQWILAPPAP